MRKYIFFLFFAFFPLFLPAQEKGSNKIQKLDSIKETITQKKDSAKTDFVPFAIIEQPPIFPGCEKLNKNLQKLCLQNQIKNYVSKNYNLKIVKKLHLKPGIKRIYVRFKIDKKGYIKEVAARGPHKKLEKEGIRVIKSLPKMIPGKQKNKNVGVKYTLPITFYVE